MQQGERVITVLNGNGAVADGDGRDTEMSAHALHFLVCQCGFGLKFGYLLPGYSNANNICCSPTLNHLQNI